MNLFKKTLATTLTASLVLSSVPAFADEAPIAAPSDEIVSSAADVQVNGEYIEFTDAVPVIRNDRVYVPFRAVFEKLAADVNYDEDENLITAVSGDTTVKFTVGDAEVTVEKNGESETKEIDAASFVENDRAYVPVRFAAEALNCEVGWDADYKTVVILDKEGIASDYTGKFELMNKYSEYVTKMEAENPSYTGKLNLAVDVTDGTEKYSVTGKCDITGKVTDTQAIVNTAVTLNLDDLAKAIEAEDEMDDETKEMLESAKSFNCDVVVDTADGTMYLSCSLINKIFGVADNTWFKVDLNEMLSGSGITLDYSKLMQTGDINYEEYAATMLDAIDVNNAYSTEAIMESLDMISKMFSDDSFTKNGNTYVSKYSYTDSMDMGYSSTTTLFAEGDEITGCQIDMVVTMGAQPYMNMSVSQKGVDTTINMSMDMMGMVKMTMDGKMTYGKENKMQLNAPKDSDNIISVNDLFDL